MAVWLLCKKGHRWKPGAPPDGWPPDFRSFCPDCGGGPIGWYSGQMVVGMVLGTIIPALIYGLSTFFFGNGTERVVGALGAVLLPVIVAAIVGVWWWIRRKRAKKIAGLAEQMGFTLVPLLYPPSLQAVAPFRLVGQICVASDAMQGRVGDCNVLVFDCQWILLEGKMVQGVSKSVVILFDGAVGKPDFLLTPKAFFDKEVDFFGPHVVAPEGAEEFDKRCVLIAPGDAALRQTFHPSLIRRLGQDGQWFIEAANGQLLLYRSPKVPPDGRPGLVTDALEISDLLRGKSPASS